MTYVPLPDLGWHRVAGSIESYADRDPLQARVRSDGRRNGSDDAVTAVSDDVLRRSSSGRRRGDRPADRLVPQRRRLARAARRVGRAPAERVPAVRARDPGAGQRARAVVAAAARPVPRLRRTDLGPVPAGRAGHRRPVRARRPWFAGPTWVLPALLYLAAISVALALIDIDTKRLPDAIVLPSYPVALVAAGARELEPRRRRRTGRRCCARSSAARCCSPSTSSTVARLPGGDGVRRRQARRRARPLPRLVRVGRARRRLVRRLPARRALLRRAARCSAARAASPGIPFGPWMLLGAAVGIVAGEPLWDWYLGVL